MKLHFIALVALFAAASAYSSTANLRNGVVDMEAAGAENDVNIDMTAEEVENALNEEEVDRKLSSFIKIKFPTIKFPTLPVITKAPTLAPTNKLIKLPEACGKFDNSKIVQGYFTTASTNWGECESHLSTISSSTSTISTNVGYVNKALTVIAKLTEEMKSASTKVYNAANTALSSLKSIPKVGKVIKAFLEILEKAKKLLEQVDSRIDKVKSLMSKIGTAFSTVATTFKGLVVSAKAAKTGYSTAASVTSTSITCTGKTESCADDTVVETHNVNIKSSVSSQVKSSETCPNVFSKIASTLKAIADAIKESVFKAIEKALDALWKVLKPLIDALQKILDEIKDHLSEAYCCATPYGLQVGLKVIGQVLDLATCPVDGYNKGIDAAMSVLEDALNNMINLVLSKVLSPVSNVALLVPTLNAGSAQASSCTFKLPTVTTKMVYPFQPWLDALKYDKPSLATFSHAALAFGSAIVDTCKEAADEIGKGLKKDCCLDYKPLSDGQFCDPTSNVPYKKCTQCTSGTNSWWFDRFHIACGKSPCGKDGAHCGLGTTCNQCCNGHSYWYKKAFTACGKEPCWGDGTKCLAGTSCKACCRTSTFWAKKFFTACGSEPCWGGGTRCLEGTTCKECCSGSKWVWNKFGHFCK